MTIDEQLIERYVCHPARLSDAEREAAEALLTRSPAAREIAGMLEAFYEAFDATGDVPSAADEAFLDHLYPPDRGATPARVIPLHPYRVAKGPTVLAARTHGTARRFVTLATLVAEADHVLLRLVWDAERRQGHLYLMEPDQERDLHALILFPDFGLQFVTDEKGQAAFTLTDEQMDVPWATASATLHRPQATCLLTRRHLVTEHVSCTFDDLTLHLRIHPPEGEQPPAYAVLEIPERNVLIPLRTGTGQVTLETQPDAFTVRLYP